MMHMEAESSGGFWSVSAEHLPGLVALVATPVVVAVAVLGCRQLAARGSSVGSAGARVIDRLSVAARVTLVACLIGATVHAAMVSTHWHDERSTAWWFAIDAVGFLVAAGWTLLGRAGWRTAGLGMLAVTSAAYIYYVAERGERLDIVGLATTTVELAAAMFLLQPVVADVRHQPPAYPWVAAATVPVALLTVFGVTTVAEGEAEMSHSETSEPGYIEYTMGPMPGMDHGSGSMNHGSGGMHHGSGGMDMGEGEPFQVATHLPGGPILWPVSHEAMDAGMTMVPSSCTASPSAAQQRAAVSLVTRTSAAVDRYRSLAAAKRDGYLPITPTGRTVVHYIDPGVYQDAEPLDPDAVPSLVYVNTARGAVLSAAMYLMPLQSEAAPPQPGGCLTQWHVHHELCFRDFAVVATTVDGTCPTGTVNRVTPPMMHVWLTPVAGGALAMDADDADAVRAASRVPLPSPRNGTA